MISHLKVEATHIVLDCIVAVLAVVSSGGTSAQVITEFGAGISAGSQPRGIAAGPDGNFWFISNLGIGRIFTTDGIATEFSAGLTPGVGTRVITAGAEGNLWFTEPAVDRLGRITACLERGRLFAVDIDACVIRQSFEVGQVIVFTASVAGNFATGTVQFMDGDVDLGPLVSLSGGGIAQLMAPMLSRARAITAIYSGDDHNAPSASPVLSQLVKKGHHRATK